MTAEQTGRDRIAGRVLESRGTDDSGGRVFGVRIIAYGDSKNARRYPEAVMRAAVPLYEGAKAYDHHRDDAELTSSTINGLVGSYRNVSATSEGIEADLHLLPGATHTAESLDASLAAQAAGLPPLVGVSHDVMATYKPIAPGGRRLQEAVRIVSVNSADVVADPAAGGQATRMVAGGTDLDTTTTTVDAPELHDSGTARGRAVIAAEATARGLPAAVAEHLTGALPARFSEAQLSAAIDAVQAVQGQNERAGLLPTTASTRVGQEARDKKVTAIDAMLSIDGAAGGYRSLREAYLDFTGHQVRFLGADLNRQILAASMGRGYDSAMRSTESMDSSTWAEVLGDSITRRLIAEYQQPDMQTWRLICSMITTANDFRTQRRPRMGGYGTLPTVNQGAPYQPLTSPTDEEATYAISKRGGTEDVTLEMIANDDIMSLRLIPVRLGRAAAQTLYRFVWDMLATNPTTTYDGLSLFHATHANTDNPAVLTQSALSTGRRKMRKQAAYGDAVDILSIVPKFLVVPADLEELAWQLCTSLVAMPSGAPTGAASDIPNLHQGMTPLVVDYYTDTNDWYLVGDPARVPTIEVGFYATSPDPELFTQSDPSVGSMFDADKVTYKIRHIYSGTVLDHRGFYRGNN